MTEPMNNVCPNCAQEPQSLEERVANYQPHASDCCGCQKIRNQAERKALLNRLSRIEGQVRGLSSMVERDAYCADILVQVSATSAALNGFTKELLYDHIGTCVADDLKAGNDDKMNELLWLLSKLLR